ncbi:hypothetical protein P3X46_017548 [Hevea brasiliensis]|uniref:EngC GTPase domain-containing protein n=1 Tax=Hevea brasiliensis TaxID=3981 RepID=A0ABQ9LS40_HEVBR|nr:small ribosomal subunit biogenesis GTPase RsgA 1, mitochondrial [Hevea brasiliensis]KAJ9169344.1 hypothetical protein P3X46_017548 [Hevea brasiliensis]
MSIASMSLFLHRTPTLHNLLRRITSFRHLPVIAAKQQQQKNPNNVSRKPQPNKNLLRAKQSFKEYSSLAPVLSLEDKPDLSDSQAIGTVAAAQANFMRVIIQSLPSSSELSSTFQKSEEEASSSNSDEGKIGVELLCVVRAVLKKIKRRVLVGDKVVVGSIDWVDRRGMIENVFQRSSEILDPPIANVDHLLVLFSMEQPQLEPFTLTRFLVEAESTGIPLTLALNKSELVDEGTLVAWKRRLRSWGYEPVFCSVESKRGLDSLAFILRDQTTVIVGPSGVGKSSLINVLRNNPRACDAAEVDNWFDPILGSKWFEEQRVGEVSTRSGRGKHTTRNVSLLPLSGGGYLADTPGFNQPSLLKVTKQSLAQAFPEIRKMLSATGPAKCTFSDCLHLGEPGCIVKGDWERYSFYFQLLDEIRIREEFQLRTYGTKKEADVRYKVGDMGVQQAEPRLEPKKHRRQSRKRINQSILDELDELDDDDNSLDEENDPFLRALRNENQ